MRTPLHSWTTLLTRLGFSGKKRRPHSRIINSRKLRFEQCEDRRLLAITVDVTHDIFNLSDNDTTLREAIIEANEDEDHNTILFDLPPNQDTITLTHGELSITESVTIDTVGQDITIDANNGSRVFTINASSSSGEVKLSGLTITGGDSSLNGGGLYFDSSAFPSGDVTLTPY